jgi:5-methylcytosine-specific restriction endonuclease McrA
VPAEVMTALIVGGRECCVEGCYNRGYLERDHRHDYAKGGPTSYENLDWYCARDHDKKTKGWIVGEPNPVTGKRTLRPPPARPG